MLDLLYYEHWLRDDRDTDMEAKAPPGGRFPEHFIDFDDRSGWIRGLVTIAHKATRTRHTHMNYPPGVPLAAADNVKPFLEELFVVGVIMESVKRTLTDLGFLDRDDRVAHYWKKPLLRLFDKYRRLGHLDEIIEYFDRFRRERERDPSLRDCLIGQDAAEKPPPRRGAADPAKMVAVLEVAGKPARIVDSHQHFSVQFWNGPIFDIAGGDPAIHGHDDFLKVQTKEENPSIFSGREPSPNFRPVTFRPFDWESKADLQLLREYRRKTAARQAAEGDGRCS